MSRRAKIATAIKDQISNTLNGVLLPSNIFNNAGISMVFPDSINDFPHLCVVPSSESREYLPGGFKWGFLGFILRVYVREEAPLLALEPILEDIETVLDSINDLEYSPGKFAREITINSITTDHGLLAPLGIGEIAMTVRYDL